ncbi:unnamed protein product [Nippostrongylus brasiliensis]|uniref:RRM domain-containing protein n=1 Tax=Nippostrongylus brasiliensis TaxID=27835 RepID=A0A158R326_NIPBR|nr:unnamed protein product [Nippostrongylus brasiliensis]
MGFTYAPPTIINNRAPTMPMGQVGPSPMQSVFNRQTIMGHEGPATVPFNPVVNAAAPAEPHGEIGYDTNSKDPVMVRSRVFIGRIATVPVTRDDLIDLFKPFGTVLALNHFKQGYAFVQFSAASEADAAVAGLHGKKWMGNILGKISLLAITQGASLFFHYVHLVDPNAGKKKEQPESARKRGAEDDGHESQVLKVSREDSATVDDIGQQNARNRVVALSDSTMNPELFRSGKIPVIRSYAFIFNSSFISHFELAEMADTMICGACRYVTADYEAFKDHRIAGCVSVRDKDEPKYLKCCSCGSRFKSAWALLYHLTEFHRMKLYELAEKGECSPLQEQSTKQESGCGSVEAPAQGSSENRSAEAAAANNNVVSSQANDNQQPSFGSVFTGFSYPGPSSWKQYPASAGGTSSQYPQSASSSLNGSGSNAMDSSADAQRSTTSRSDVEQPQSTNDPVYPARQNVHTLTRKQRRELQRLEMESRRDQFDFRQASRDRQGADVGRSEDERQTAALSPESYLRLKWAKKRRQHRNRRRNARARKALAEAEAYRNRNDVRVDEQGSSEFVPQPHNP